MPLPALRLMLAAALLLTAGVPPVAAQFDTASVVGTVHDATGAVVPDATVTLTSADTGVSATRRTTTDGHYEFSTVKSGVYIVTSEKDGFAIALVDAVQVEVGARLRIDLRMEVGQITEKVVNGRPKTILRFVIP